MAISIGLSIIGMILLRKTRRENQAIAETLETKVWDDGMT